MSMFPLRKSIAILPGRSKIMRLCFRIIPRQSGTTLFCRVGEMYRISQIRRMNAMRQSLLRLRKLGAADVILYMTSPETQNEDPVAEPYNVASADRDTAVGRRMKKALQPKAVIPVPLAIKNIQTDDADKPGTDLVFRYHNDGQIRPPFWWPTFFM